MGGRIAQLRKEQNLTQQNLAEELGVTQQVVASYEIGRRRVPVSALPKLARTLGVSIEALIGEEPGPAKRGPTPKLHRRRVSSLPVARERAGDLQGPDRCPRPSIPDDVRGCPGVSRRRATSARLYRPRLE